VDGIHDMGGMHGFGRVPMVPDEEPSLAHWEQRVTGMVYQWVGRGWANIDAFRHAIERLPPATYLTVGYYGRWLAALELLATEAGVLAPGAVDARLAGEPATAAEQASPPGKPAMGFVRPLDRAPRFAVGTTVRARNLHPAGHTRLPRYVRGRCGVVERIHPACVFPDANAHGRGEEPQHLYAVRFAAAELWGPEAEPGTSVSVDLFEPYLEPA
jgi:nitrile hydratase